MTQARENYYQDGEDGNDGRFEANHMSLVSTKKGDQENEDRERIKNYYIK